MALLNKYRDQLPPDLFTKPFELPVTDGSGNNRDELRGALALLEQAGWKVRDRKLVDAEGQPFSFEILLDQPAFERVALPYVQWLARAGDRGACADGRPGAVSAADRHLRLRHDRGRDRSDRKAPAMSKPATGPATA